MRSSAALVFLGQRRAPAATAVETAVDEKVVMQRERAERARRFLEHLPLDDRAVDRQRRRRPAQPLDGARPP